MRGEPDLAQVLSALGIGFSETPTYCRIYAVLRRYYANLRRFLQ